MAGDPGRRAVTPAIKPRALRSGGVIGVVAPAGPIDDADLQCGIEVLEDRGYRVEVGSNVRLRHAELDYLAGPDTARAEDLNVMFGRHDVDAVFCARGGYGCARLLPCLDWDLITRNPKLFVGYSDITTMHLALDRRAGLCTLYGPNLASLSALDALASRVFWSAVEDADPLQLPPAHAGGCRTLVPGTAEGRLAGGCLTLLARSCGTPWAPDFEGRIVLIEDVGEAIYRSDRDLAQLANCGLLAGAAGFVIGSLTRWHDNEAEGSRNDPSSLWRSYIKPLGKPAITGFPFGHEPNPWTLPLGTRVRLDAGSRTLSALEPAARAS